MTDSTGWRDRLAQRCANWALNHIATPEYRHKVSGCIRYGMNAAARDEKEDIPAPEHWTTYVEHDRWEEFASFHRGLNYVNEGRVYDAEYEKGNEVLGIRTHSDRDL